MRMTNGQFRDMIATLARAGALREAGMCIVSRRSTTPRHPQAPYGASQCHNCGRVVVRRCEEWWL